MNADERRWTIILDLLLLLGVVVLFYPQVGRPGVMSPGGDMVNLMLPAREWATRWLARGIIPLWNPQTFGGVPFVGAMQAAVFYPPNLVAGAFLSPLAAINLLRLVHIYLFGALTWLFLRLERGHARPAALLGAIAVAGSAHVASHLDHINQLAAMAWLPALVACQWRYWRTRSHRALLAFALVVAIQILAGHPQAAFYSLLLSAAIALQSVISSQRSAISNPRSRVLAVGCFSLALVGGLLLASLQLVPTAETARLSRRSLDGPEYPLWGSMAPRFIWAVVAPRAFGDPLEGYSDPQFSGECGSFVGRTTLLLAIVAVGVGIVRRRSYAVFWALVVIVAFVLALGGYGPFATAEQPSPVFRAYLWLLPPAQHLRVPMRILLLATFAMAVLGAEGLEWLWRRRWWLDQARRRWIRLPAAWAVVAVLVVELWAFQRGEYHHRVVRHDPPEILLSGDRREVLAPLLRARGADQSLADFRLFRLMVHDPDYLIDWRPDAVRNRYVRLQPNLGMLLGVAEVEGYEEGLLPPVRYFDFLNYFNRNLRSPDPDAVLLALMNVRYLYADYNTPVQSETWRAVGEVVEPVTARRYRLYENPLWLPRVVWADWFDDRIALGALRGTLSRGGPPSARMATRQSYGLHVGAIAARGWLVEPGRLATVRIRSIEPNRIVAENPERRGGRLLVAQNAYPGWVVEAAGETVPLRPATDFSGAAVVQAGAAEIAIVYRPFSFRLGVYLSALALAVWVALATVAAVTQNLKPET